MSIVGLGTDIIEISRIAEMLERHEERFLERVFTPSEVAYCQRHKSCTQHFAGRWAAKEAALKALGTGMIRGLSWQDIEVVNDAGGKPAIVMSGGVLKTATDRSIGQMLITISHCKLYATATAIAVSE